MMTIVLLWGRRLRSRNEGRDWTEEIYTGVGRRRRRRRYRRRMFKPCRVRGRMSLLCRDSSRVQVVTDLSSES